jgi:hypothetical protein
VAIPSQKLNETRSAHPTNHHIMQIRYIHTIDGKAATFDGEQVCFSVRTIPITTCGNLKEIRCQQTASDQWRIAHNFTNFGHRFGYRRVRFD